MPLKHGISHALMLIIAPMLSAIIIALIKPEIPVVIDFINSISKFIIQKIGLSVPIRLMSIGLVSIVIAFGGGFILHVGGFYRKSYLKNVFRKK